MAVIVALVTSTVLLGMAAFTVDFGDTFARRASLDGVADEAARAGAQYLPDSAVAVTHALDNLCASGNRDSSWDATVCPGAGVPAWALDGSVSNGQIEVFSGDSNGNGRFDDGTDPRGLNPGLDDERVAVGDPAIAIRVILPPATVRFGLGQVLGVSSIAVAPEPTRRSGLR